MAKPPVGLLVEDLDETVRFLALLGFDCGEPGMFSGEWIDRIIGLENVTVETVMARAPDGSDMFELVRFHSPFAGAQEPAPAANRPGLRHVAFKVDDARGVVDRVREGGWETAGEIVDFENTFLLCYLRGPEGLLVGLAERLDRAGLTAWSAGAGRAELRQAAAMAGVRRRFAPHQLRHAHAIEMAREGVQPIVIQRQLGYTKLGSTSIYLQGIDSAEIIETVHARRPPMVPIDATLPL